MVLDNRLEFLAEVPATGAQTFLVTPGPAQEDSLQSVDKAVIENEFIRLECDRLSGIRSLVLKQTNQTLLSNASDFLVAQQDDGSFQIEAPIGAEVPANAGKIEVYACPPTPLGPRLQLKGRFPELPWAGKENALSWEMELFLLPGKPALDVALKLHWRGESSRIRFKLSSCINSSVGIYEIPFGTVRRSPYRPRVAARGEWPAFRFVAIEDNNHGLALINTGTAGVETGPGIIWNTLLRAPRSEYGGMYPDDTSSQHGDHAFGFRLVPYQGAWDNSPVVRAAQELNNPLLAIIGKSPVAEKTAKTSWLRLEPHTMVLSTVKAPEDNGPDMIVRFYETAGRPGTARLFVQDAREAWLSDLREDKLGPLACRNGRIETEMKPFEIKTLRIKRA
jgi:alpha-mannosidase